MPEQYDEIRSMIKSKRISSYTGHVGDEQGRFERLLKANFDEKKQEKSEKTDESPKEKPKNESKSPESESSKPKNDSEEAQDDFPAPDQSADDGPNEDELFEELGQILDEVENELGKDVVDQVIDILAEYLDDDELDEVLEAKEEADSTPETDGMEPFDGGATVIMGVEGDDEPDESDEPDDEGYVSIRECINLRKSGDKQTGYAKEMEHMQKIARVRTQDGRMVDVRSGNARRIINAGRKAYNQQNAPAEPAPQLATDSAANPEKPGAGQPIQTEAPQAGTPAPKTTTQTNLDQFAGEAPAQQAETPQAETPQAETPKTDVPEPPTAAEADAKKPTGVSDTDTKTDAKPDGAAQGSTGQVSPRDARFNAQVAGAGAGAYGSRLGAWAKKAWDMIKRFGGWAGRKASNIAQNAGPALAHAGHVAGDLGAVAAGKMLNAEDRLYNAASNARDWVRGGVNRRLANRASSTAARTAAV